MSTFIKYNLIHLACFTVGFQSGMSYILLIFFNGQLKRHAATEIVNEDDQRPEDTEIWE